MYLPIDVLNQMALLLWFLLLVITSFHVSSAQTQTTNIVLGSRLIANTQNTSSWPSPSGDFAFGFYNLTEDRFLIGIWFDKIPGRTLVWSHNRSRPVQIGSILELTTAGKFIINDSQGNVTSIYDLSPSANSASMRDDGNFVLSSSNGNIIWESFQSPTDTLLPGQSLKGQTLFSNANGTVDYSTGRFRLEMQKDGNLVLTAYRYADPSYWNSQTKGENGILLFNATTKLMYIYNITPIYNLTAASSLPTSIDDYYHRATFDDGGNFQQFTYQKANGSWTMVWQAIKDPCTVNALCGEYGYCVLDDNKKTRCLCPPMFSLLDPNNPLKGCYPDFEPQRCGGVLGKDSSVTNFKVNQLTDADYPNNYFADLGRLTDADADSCKKALMEDCNCMVAVLLVPERLCLKKRMPVLNGRQSNTSRGSIVFIKVAMATTSQDGRKKDPLSRVVLAGLIVTSSLVIFLILAIALYCFFARPSKLMKSSSSSANAAEISLRAFTFSELQEATSGFSNRLGRGAFGTVFSGIILSEDGEKEIAVKQLEKVMERGEKEFLTELKVIGRTHHKNLVQLLGYCNEDSHRLLVYELMKKGSLSSYLFGEEKPKWGQRVEIAMGIARGLLYLHDECDTQIIHCDIKPGNVLLDDNYNAKIADFGLAKLLMKDQTRTSTNARGTMGYMAPEWLKNAAITAKVDVYSFGVMLLEIICCRRHIELDRVEEETEDEDLYISDWIVSCMRDGDLKRVVETDAEALIDFARFERLAMVGLWCVHPNASFRPSMKKVMLMMEGTVQVGISPLISG